MFFGGFVGGDFFKFRYYYIRRKVCFSRRDNMFFFFGRLLGIWKFFVLVRKN